MVRWSGLTPLRSGESPASGAGPVGAFRLRALSCGEVGCCGHEAARGDRHHRYSPRKGWLTRHACYLREAMGYVHIIRDFDSPLEGVTRTVRIYTPDAYEDGTDRRFPVLYMQDGQNVF